MAALFTPESGERQTPEGKIRKPRARAGKVACLAWLGTWCGSTVR
jgi:hypothetical protein